MTQRICTKLGLHLIPLQLSKLFIFKFSTRDNISVDFANLWSVNDITLFSSSHSDGAAGGSCVLYYVVVSLVWCVSTFRRTVVPASSGLRAYNANSFWTDWRLKIRNYTPSKRGESRSRYRWIRSMITTLNLFGGQCTRLATKLKRVLCERPSWGHCSCRVLRGIGW